MYKNTNTIKLTKGIFVIHATLSLLLSACSNPTTTAPTQQAPSAAQPVAIKTPVFDADTAYSFVDHQVAMGPRTPGSAAQAKCAEWMQTELKQFCDTVYKQSTSVKGGDGKMLPCINLIGVVHPNAAKRILLLTHWDSRPWADMDTKQKDQPILAADDAGSGVAVLLELLRCAKNQATPIPANVGIDILFTDVEDYCRSEWGETSYCLGTQYWATHPHIAGYKADFGILLDMVGAKGARFPMEGMSAQFADAVQQKVWSAAGRAGFSSYFIFAPGGSITDDHVPVNKITGIKTIDIINLTPNPENPFAPHWHTHADNMDVIDKNTLKAVGQSLLQVIYEEGQQQG